MPPPQTRDSLSPPCCSHFSKCVIVFSVARTFFILLVIVFLGHATGIMTFMTEAACVEHCPNKQLDTQSTPLCQCSTCSTGHRSLPSVAQIALSQPQVLPSMSLSQLSAPPSPAPFKIFHVPERVFV